MWSHLCHKQCLQRRVGEPAALTCLRATWGAPPARARAAARPRVARVRVLRHMSGQRRRHASRATAAAARAHRAPQLLRHCLEGLAHGATQASG